MVDLHIVCPLLIELSSPSSNDSDIKASITWQAPCTTHTYYYMTASLGSHCALMHACLEDFCEVPNT